MTRKDRSAGVDVHLIVGFSQPSQAMDEAVERHVQGIVEDALEGIRTGQHDDVVIRDSSIEDAEVINVRLMEPGEEYEE